MKRTKKTKKPSTKPYSISIRIAEEVYTGEGETMLEALMSLPRPAKITTKAILQVSNGARGVESVFMPVKTKRLFYPLARKVIANQFEYLLK